MADIAQEFYPSKGKVSYYTNKSVDPRWGGITKGGQKFDENAMTMAILPNYWKQYGMKKFRVTNPISGAFVDVTANDTGGFKKYNRVGDLSKSAFSKLFDISKGVGDIVIEPLG